MRKDEDTSMMNSHAHILGVKIPWWFIVLIVLFIILLCTEIYGITRFSHMFEKGIAGAGSLSDNKNCILSEESVNALVTRIIENRKSIA